MRTSTIKRWYLRGRRRCYNAAYAHTIYSARYYDVVYNRRKYIRKYGARMAKWFSNGIADEHDNFLEMERDYYGRVWVA